MCETMDKGFKDYYDILGIEYGASLEEIKRAWKRKMRQYHPDRFANADEEGRKRANEMAKLVNEAYQTLKDEESRRRYDQIYRIKKGLTQPAESPVIGTTKKEAIYHVTQTPQNTGAVYTGAIKMPFLQVEHKADTYARRSDAVYGIIEAEAEEVAVITRPITQTTMKRDKVSVKKEPEFKRKVERDMSLINIGIVGTLSVILILLFVLPFFIPGYPNIIKMAFDYENPNTNTEENDQNILLDSDKDGIPDDQDIYPYGDGVIVIEIIYFHIINFGEEYTKIHPFFVFYMNDKNYTTDPYWDMTEFSSDENHSIYWVFKIPDDIKQITVCVRAFHYVSDPEKQHEEIDLDKRPYMRYARYTYRASELKKTYVITEYGNGAEDDNDGEIDATIIFAVKVKDVMDAWG